MRDRLDQSHVHPERGADQLLAVPGDTGGRDTDVRTVTVQIGEVLPQDRHRVAAVGGVKRTEQVPFLVDEHRFHGRRAGVDAERERPDRGIRHAGIARVAVVAAAERLELRFVAEQGVAPEVSAL